MPTTIERHRAEKLDAILQPLLFLLVAIVCGCSKDPAATTSLKTEPAPPKIKFGRVVPLRTQWYPLRAEWEDESEDKLLRELVRQGVLIAIRDDLGLVTRDETLEEPVDTGAPPDSAEPLSLSLNVDTHGLWEVQLYGAGATQDNPVWNHRGNMEWNRRTIYSQFAQQMDEKSNVIADKLRQAGAAATAAPINPNNKTDVTIERQLEQMNFGSQFMAVRAAHESIRKTGPSPEWLGVLVRGYANLAMLTEHTWSSHREAFAARSLLYAERMCRLTSDAAAARWHRAYARSLIGAHAAAIDELNALAKQDQSAQPAWAPLLAPYVHFDNDGLIKAGKNHPPLAQLVALLSWNQYRSYMHGRWIYEQGIAAAKDCPEAYGIYSTMANTEVLGVKRTGAAMGTQAFATLLPKRMRELFESASDTALRDAMAPTDAKTEKLDEGAQISVPMKLAKALKDAAAKETQPTECSLAILAGLIAEEQFVQAADMLRVSGDATEHSDKSLVDELTPLVEGHRYAAYIRSFAPSRSEPQRIAEIIHPMTIVDPRPSMRPMFSRMWHTPILDGKDGNQLQYRAIWERSSTLTNLRDTYYQLALDWTEVIKPEVRQRMAKEFRDVSPASPNAVRLQWETATNLSGAELAKLEKQLKNDPVGWLSLAEAYLKANYLESAERCYKRSIEISPSHAATSRLASLYLQKKRKDLWLSTLEAYLKVEDIGLGHAAIREEIAQQLIRDRQWKKAEPYAVAAAETYSFGGLLMASKVYEGLQDWKKSEYFAAEATRSYPTYMSGTTWYFWCRRTGRGDVKAAREIAKANIDLASQQTRFDEAYRVFAYRLLEDDKAGALAGLDRQIATCLDTEDQWEACWRHLHTIALAGELHDKDRQKKAIADLTAHVEEHLKPTHPNWAELYTAFATAFSGQPFQEDFYAKLDTAMADADPQYHCNYYYFVGAALDQLGDKKKAELYWRRSAFGGQFDTLNATLAGYRLVARHGPERGGIPDEFLASDDESTKPKK